MSEEVVLRAGEDSRRNARIPVRQIVEKMRAERDQLIQEKRDIEYKLTQVEDWRKEETSQILGKRLNKTRSIEMTTRLEAQVREKKKPLLQEKQAIEKRMLDIKSKIGRKGTAPRVPAVRDGLLLRERGCIQPRKVPHQGLYVPR